MYQSNIIFITTLCMMSLAAQSAPTTETEQTIVSTMTPPTGHLTFPSPSTTTVSPNSSPIPDVEQNRSSELPTSTITTITTTTTSTTPSPTTTPVITPTVEPLSVTTTGETSSAPATDALKDLKTTSPMTSQGDNSITQQNRSILEKSNFTCLSKNLGYYADIQEDCKVYHFCLLGEYSGESVYQRITYKCLNDTYFDQQALDCVEQSKMSAPCGESHLYYETSNVVLRQAVVGTNTQQNNSNTNSTAAP